MICCNKNFEIISTNSKLKKTTRITAKTDAKQKYIYI